MGDPTPTPTVEDPTPTPTVEDLTPTPTEEPTQPPVEVTPTPVKIIIDPELGASNLPLIIGSILFMGGAGVSLGFFLLKKKIK